LLVQADSNPASPTFGTALTMPPAAAAVPPASGTFVAGHFVRNSAAAQGPTVLQGWSRTTTGSGVAVGVDWAPLYALSQLTTGTLIGKSSPGAGAPEVISLGANLTLVGGQLLATVQTRTSQLNNDSGFLTNAVIPTRISQLANDSGFLTATTLPYASTTTFGALKVDGVTAVVNNGTLSVGTPRSSPPRHRA
jgi:hypothetical protein